MMPISSLLRIEFIKRCNKINRDIQKSLIMYDGSQNKIERERIGKGNTLFGLETVKDDNFLFLEVLRNINY